MTLRKLGCCLLLMHIRHAQKRALNARQGVVVRTIYKETTQHLYAHRTHSDAARFLCLGEIARGFISSLLVRS